jgi:hypothetical protein
MPPPEARLISGTAMLAYEDARSIDGDGSSRSVAAAAVGRCAAGISPVSFAMVTPVAVRFDCAEGAMGGR